MSSHLLPRLFPVPRLLAMDGGGIDISEHTIKYFSFDVLTKRREVARFGEVQLPAGVIVDGDIRNKEALVRALSQVRERCGFTFTYASLPEQKGYLFDTVSTVDPSASLSRSVEVALSEQVPLAPAEVVFDCEVVPAESGATVRSVVVTAFPETIAQQYTDALRAAGFSPLSFELEPQAALRAIIPRTMRGACIIVDLGLSATTLSVVQNDAVRFTTSIAGSEALDDSLYDSLKGKEEGRGDAAWIGAELSRLKYEEGLAEDSSIVHPCLGYAKGVTTVLDRVSVYWQLRIAHGDPLLPISSIVLYGGNALMRGFVEHVSHSMHVPCRVADLHPALGGGGVIPPIHKNDSMRYATVIGLALRAAAHNSL